MSGIHVEQFFYESNGHRVEGWLARPEIVEEKLPVVVWNRGGYGDYGLLTQESVTRWMGKIAAWGYIVIGSQYSGNGQSEGKDELGGQEIQDVLNLYPVIQKLPEADLERIGMYGPSRGGMTTYLALPNAPWVKAVVILGGLSNAVRWYDDNPLMRFKIALAGIQIEKKDLEARSAILWADRFSKTTPILLLHGKADADISVDDSIEIAKEFERCGVPHKLELFEGGDHRLSTHREERDRLTREWFDHHLKNPHN
jgi:dipeptidyl aminopeptidase/acylaminoacyl peptidase